MKHSDLSWSRLIDAGKKLVGKKYVLGAEVKLTDPDPDHITAIDCSELVEWLFANLQKVDGSPAGLAMPDGSYNQAKFCRKLAFAAGTHDVLLLGDLGFKHIPETGAIHHVGIFIGEGMVLEAKGKAWGVVLTPFADFQASEHFAYWARHKSIEDA